MDNNFYRYPETEIDLKEFALDLLSQWKAILIVALLLAVLACTARHAKDVNEYKADLEAQREAEKAKLTIEEQIENVYELLAPEERTAVEFIVSEQDWINKQKQYLRESILMKTDPNNQRVLSMVFDIDAENASDIPVLLQAYYSFMYSDELVNAVKPVIAPKAEDKYIKELFIENKEHIYEEAEQESAAVMLNVVLPEETDKDAFIEVSSDAIMKYSEKISAKYTHSISLASAESLHMYRSIADTRMTLFNSVNSTELNLKNAKGNLSNEQRNAVDIITKLLEGGNPEALGTEDSAKDSELKKPGWSKKMAVFGFMLGAIMYTGFYLLWMMLKRQLNYAVSAGHYSGSRLLGEIYEHEECKGLKTLMHSKTIEYYRFKGYTDEQLQINKALSSIEAICEHAKVSTVSLLAFDGDKLGFNMADKLAHFLSKRGIKPEIVEIEREINEKKLLSKENAIYVIGKGSEIASICETASLCSDYNVTTLGSIFVGKTVSLGRSLCGDNQK